MFCKLELKTVTLEFQNNNETKIFLQYNWNKTYVLCFWRQLSTMFTVTEVKLLKVFFYIAFDRAKSLNVSGKQALRF